MNNVIISASLLGGLGNQMFQIAHAYAQGLKNNLTVTFKPEAGGNMQGNKPINYLKNIFRDFNFDSNINNLKRVSEPGWYFTPLNIKWEESIEFYGYFQSSKNFYGYNNEIKNKFKPSEEFLSKIYTIYPQLLNKNNLSLHVRRGDYLMVSHILPVVSKQYIEYCVNKIGEYDYLFVFSDDKQWVKNNLKYPNMIVVEGLEDYEELWTISLCKNNIMSNSSFSWWGVFLSEFDDKRVLCPYPWFGPAGEKKFDDIYEEKWEKVNLLYKHGELTL